VPPPVCRAATLLRPHRRFPSTRGPRAGEAGALAATAATARCTTARSTAPRASRARPAAQPCCCSAAPPKPPLRPASAALPAARRKTAAHPAPLTAMGGTPPALRAAAAAAAAAPAASTAKARPSRRLRASTAAPLTAADPFPGSGCLQTPAPIPGVDSEQIGGPRAPSVVPPPCTPSLETVPLSPAFLRPRFSHLGSCLGLRHQPGLHGKLPLPHSHLSRRLALTRVSFDFNTSRPKVTHLSSFCVRGGPAGRRARGRRAQQCCPPSLHTPPTTHALPLCAAPVRRRSATAAPARGFCLDCSHSSPARRDPPPRPAALTLPQTPVRCRLPVSPLG
jgi:hypothetical protein